MPDLWFQQAVPRQEIELTALDAVITVHEANSLSSLVKVYHAVLCNLSSILLVHARGIASH